MGALEDLMKKSGKKYVSVSSVSYNNGPSEEEKKRKRKEEALRAAAEQSAKYQKEAQKANSGVSMSLNRLLGLSPKLPKAPEPTVNVDTNRIKSIPNQDTSMAKFSLPGQGDVLQNEMAKTSQVNRPMTVKDFNNPINKETLSFKDSFKDIKDKVKYDLVLGFSKDEYTKSQKDQINWEKEMKDMLNRGQISEQQYTQTISDPKAGPGADLLNQAHSNFIMNFLGAGVAKSLPKSTMKLLAESSDRTLIETAIKGRVPDAILQRTAEEIAKTKSVRTVEEIFSGIQNTQSKVEKILAQQKKSEFNAQTSPLAPTPNNAIPEQPGGITKYLQPQQAQPEGRSVLKFAQEQAPLPAPEAPKPVVKGMEDQVLQDAGKQLELGNQDPSKAGVFQQAKEALDRKLLTFKKNFVDAQVYAKKLVDGKLQGAVQKTDAGDFAQKMELVPGRVDTRMRAVEQETTNIIKQISKKAQELNTTPEALNADVQRYLISQHAPERNAQMKKNGAAGMTNEEALAIQEEMKGRADGTEIKKIADAIVSMNQATLDILRNGGVIGDGVYNKLKATYKYHIPLNRIQEGEDVVDYLVSTKGFSVPSSGLRKAKGSKKQVSDVIGNVQAALSEAIVRSEKNRVMQSLVTFIEDNPQLAGKDGVFEIGKRQVRGTAFDGSPIYKDLEKNQFVVRLGDEAKVITIKDDNLAAALSSLDMQHLAAGWKYIEQFTRLYSGLATRFNPEFAFSNIIRDAEEMAVFLSSQKELGFGGAAKATKDVPMAWKGVLDSMRGVDTEWSRLYRQMKMDGGTTGGMALSTRKDIQINMDKLRALQASNPRKAAKMLIDGVDGWNTLFEDSTRLATYKRALESGMSRDQAAYLAKNATINFNRKGTYGPVVNALWMFSNASIQGSAKMITSLKNPKVAAAVAATMYTTSATVNRWNDSVDPEWRTKVTDYDRVSNIVIAIPSNEGIKYVTIPVSWGLKPLKVAADAIDDYTTGHDSSAFDFAKKFAGAIIEGYNPLGGTDLGQAVMPTIGDVPLNLYSNKDWMGQQIKPEWMKMRSPEEQYFGSTAESASGRLAIGTAKTMSDMTGGIIRISPEQLKYATEQYAGGTGRAVTRLINFGINPSTKDAPFLGRFYKNKSEDQVSKMQNSQENKNFFEKLQNYENGSEEQKNFIKDRLRQLPDDKARQNLLLKLNSGGIDRTGIRASEEQLKLEPQYNKIQDLLKKNDKPAADALWGQLSKEEKDTYSNMKKADRAKNSKALDALLKEDPKKAVEFARSQGMVEANRLFGNLSNEEKALYNQGK